MKRTNNTKRRKKGKSRRIKEEKDNTGLKGNEGRQSGKEVD